MVLVFYTKITSSKQILHNVGIGSIISRGYFNHKEDPLYVPFATDAERELASIQFWVTKNTNLKEVNISLRVILEESNNLCSVPIFPFGVFLLIAMFISPKDVLYHPTPMLIALNERGVKCMVVRTTITNLLGIADGIMCSSRK